MKVIDPGHHYELDILDHIPSRHWVAEELLFVKRDTPAEMYPGNVGHHSGTTIQEVLRAVIDRLKYVNNQIPCSETGHAIGCAREMIWWLEKRAAERHGRVLAHRSFEIELAPTCSLCGHLECGGRCRSQQEATEQVWYGGAKPEPPLNE